MSGHVKNTGSNGVKEELEATETKTKYLHPPLYVWK